MNIQTLKNIKNDKMDFIKIERLLKKFLKNGQSNWAHISKKHKPMKRCPTSLITRDTQIEKTQWHITKYSLECLKKKD